MDVYIVFDRYEHNEWFYVSYVGTDYDLAYQHCIEEDLPDFICYGPDDCHSFQLVSINVSRSTYYKLKKWVNAEELDRKEQDKFDRFMIKVYEGYFEGECILSTDGQSDSYAVLSYHCGDRPEPDDYDDDEEYEDALTEYRDKTDEFMQDDELYRKVVAEYVKSTY